MAEQPAPPPADPTACRHRWCIAPPSGLTSPSIFRLCGAQRNFPNVQHESSWAVGDGSRFRRTSSP